MKLYRIEYYTEGVDEEVVLKLRWLGTQKEVAAYKKALKREPWTHFEALDIIDVPTDKPGLLAWLNKFNTSY